MPARQPMDAFGAAALVAFSALLGFNQVVIAVVNEGLQPVFFAGLRSLGAALCIWAWMRWRGLSAAIAPGTAGAGLLAGAIFTVEFVALFTALDLTTVARTSVIFYSMPVWLALAAHWLLPGERIGPRKAVGLALAMGGVAWAILDRPGAAVAGGSLAGDLCALAAALGWAAIAICARATALSRVRPEMQLLWQVAVSAPILLLLAPLFGPLVRDLAPVHLAGLAFQIVVVVSFGFILWLWLLSRYEAAAVASFSFLGPIFGAGFGWLLLGERLGPGLIGALVLVAAGLALINAPPRKAA
ncbi:DMT family transporter [Rhodobacteraceae bacterium CCMM004]|nr:DMT family transporter [Rhodobacteraceae bacterium CCMM004]